MKNNLIRGIRKASDFLMALQLTGAFKKSSLANLQVRLPAVVIGGGLTAIDTATELARVLPDPGGEAARAPRGALRSGGEEAVFAVLDPEEREVYVEFLEHGRAVRAERERAKAAGEAPDFVEAGARVGRRDHRLPQALNDSPAYRLNHEEVIKALEEGISFAEGSRRWRRFPTPTSVRGRAAAG